MGVGVALNCGPDEPDLYRLAVQACLEAKEYQKAKEFVQFGLDYNHKPLHQENAELQEVLEGLMEHINQQAIAGR